MSSSKTIKASRRFPSARARLFLAKLIVFLSALSVQATGQPTVIGDDFLEYDLFEYKLDKEWHYLPKSADLDIDEAIARLDAFIEVSMGGSIAGWWMIQFSNETALDEYAIRLRTKHDHLEVVTVSAARPIKLIP